MFRSSLRLGAIVLCTALLGACNAPPSDTVAEPDPEPFEPAPPTLAFATSMEKAKAGEFQDRYSLLTQRSIIAVVNLPGEGTHVFEFELLNPSGGVSRVFWRAISTEKSPTAHVPHPEVEGVSIPVEKVELVGGSSRAYVEFPIAGTKISRYRLAGSFSVQIRMQGSTEPFATNAFEIAQWESLP